MENAELLNEIRAELGLSHRRARRALDAVAASVGSSLSPELREALATAVPLLRPLVAHPGAGHALPFPALVEVVADAIGEPLGHALETTQVVCRVLAEHLAPDLRHRLDEQLEPDVAGLFTRRAPLEPPEPLPHPRSRFEGVATSRPGSRRSLADAGAPGQSGSLATSPEPHAATKLSSASGVPADRGAETLASGRPGSHHPLADGKH